MSALCGFRVHLLRGQHHTFCRTCELRSAARACASSASAVSRSSRFSSALSASCALAVASRFASRSSADSDSCTQNYECWACYSMPAQTTHHVESTAGPLILLVSLTLNSTACTQSKMCAWHELAHLCLQLLATRQLRIALRLGSRPGQLGALNGSPLNNACLHTPRLLPTSDNGCSSNRQQRVGCRGHIVCQCKDRREAKVCFRIVRTQHLFPSLVGCCLRCRPVILARFQWCKTLGKTLS